MNKDLRLPGQAHSIPTGIEGLDEILNGGLTAHRLYLIEGNPGSGKTTFALQFLLDGVRSGERGLYITLSETAHELRAIAASHGWSLDGIALYELINEEGLDPDGEQSILYPSEIELGETTKSVMREVDAVKPSRVAFDSLSELRLLAQNPLRYRRQILALKHYFATRNCTVMLLDDRTSGQGDLHLHSIAHGVFSLEASVQDFGGERRRLRVAKMRGVNFRGGLHDFNLATGGIRVFPRLIADHHHRTFDPAPVTTGCVPLDDLLGGGLMPGTNTLLTGPSGIGKTTTALRCALAALERGDRVAYYLFDEGIGTLLLRSKSLGMDIRGYLEDGRLQLHQIDPAALSPGEFSCMVREGVEADAVSMVVIDSLNAYLQAMPGERFLMLQMHEVLSFLNQQGVITLLVLGQHGLVGDLRPDLDLSYLSDAILLYRFFESRGHIYSAISVVKSRTNNHERNIREFRLSPEHGLQVGVALEGFDGILTGIPQYLGDTPMLKEPGAAHAG